jgi:hypothetical protein
MPCVSQYGKEEELKLNYKQLIAKLDIITAMLCSATSALAMNDLLIQGSDLYHWHQDHVKQDELRLQEEFSKAIPANTDLKVQAEALMNWLSKLTVTETNLIISNPKFRIK